MKLKTLIATGSIFLMNVGQAFAGYHGHHYYGGHGRYHGGGTPTGAPEIDATQGIAALAILVCAALIAREMFQRSAASKA
jgi:hypothetical protein